MIPLSSPPPPPSGGEVGGDVYNFFPGRKLNVKSIQFHGRPAPLLRDLSMRGGGFEKWGVGVGEIDPIIVASLISAPFLRFSDRNQVGFFFWGGGYRS